MPGWEIRYSTAVKLNVPMSGQEFSFNFPRSPGSVHYITKPVTLAASGAARASFTITTTGDPKFDYRTGADNTCDAPAAVRLFRHWARRILWGHMRRREFITLIRGVAVACSPHQKHFQTEKPPNPEKRPRTATSPKSQGVNASVRAFSHDQDP
jgi:hypothetical protein